MCLKRSFRTFVATFVETFVAPLLRFPSADKGDDQVGPSPHRFRPAAGLRGERLLRAIILEKAVEPPKGAKGARTKGVASMHDLAGSGG